MATGRANVRTHTRKNRGGGTSTVHQHTRRQSYADQADKLLDSRRPRDRRRAWRLIGYVGLMSVAWGLTVVVAGIGEAFVVSGFTIVGILLADNWRGARRAWRRRPRYLGPAARMRHLRVKARKRVADHLDRHPIQRRVVRSADRRWDAYGRKYVVVGTGPAPAKRGQARATSRKTVRGTRKVSDLDARAQAQGWTTTHERAR